MSFVEHISKAFETAVDMATGRRERRNDLIDDTSSFFLNKREVAIKDLVRDYGEDEKAREVILKHLQRKFKYWTHSLGRREEAFGNISDTFSLARLAMRTGHLDLARDIGRQACRYVEDTAYNFHSRSRIPPHELIRRELTYYQRDGGPIAEAVSESLSKLEKKSPSQVSSGVDPNP
jgi:hypothetical protein